MMAAVSPPIAIGRLRVLRRIGAGGFATVWLAHDPELDAPVAVKLLADNWSHDADVRRRFTDEARLLRRVDSDHLVRVYDLGTLPDGRPYFVMTYADRGSLADRLAERPPPWSAADVVAVVDAIAAGLTVLHEHGIVHRDLKPRNILLRSTPDGPERVLLGDLGIAKDLVWASGITQPAGSDGYMAPEQRGFSARIGPPTDVHALAVTAGQLLGLPGPPWPPGPLGSVLSAATEADPERRTASAAAFASALRATLSTVGPPPPGPPPPGPPPGPPPPQGPAAGDVTSVQPPAVDPTRLSAGPPAPPRASGGAAIRRRRTVLVAGAVAVLAVAGVTGRWYATRDVVLHDAGRHLTVHVPHDLGGAPHGVAFPGEQGVTQGVAAVASGGRAVAAAYRPGATDVEDVLAAAASALPQGCTAGVRGGYRVGTWTGVATRFDRCPDGVTVDEVVLQPSSGDPWTVWVEVRSTGGSPGVQDVLAGLDVDPAA